MVVTDQSDLKLLEWGSIMTSSFLVDSNIPGALLEVWNGWVWVYGGVEQLWSKRDTPSECVQAVKARIAAVGIEMAFVVE